MTRVSSRPQELRLLAGAVALGMMDPRYRPVLSDPQLADAYDTAMRMAGRQGRAVRRQEAT